MSKPDVAQVKAFLLQLQDEICRSLEQAGRHLVPHRLARRRPPAA